MQAPSVASAIDAALDAGGGWLRFDRYQALALYAPGAGYYTGGTRVFGTGPGSDFVTAPEISPLFGAALARHVAQALQASGTDEVWEFGAGTGALAVQLLDALPDLRRYTIVELSGSLRERQRAALAPHAARVEWAAELPPAMRGVVVGNEVLDAMPVRLLHRTAEGWVERGVVAGPAWADRPTDARPPEGVDMPVGATIEIHPQAEAFVATLAERMERGTALFLDYGFPRHEYYHPQRATGTLMCHRGHRADPDPLEDPGSKDITSHIDFTGIALAGQEAGFEVAGYTSQAHFLFDCGIVDLMAAADFPMRANAQRLVVEHEMGELFKAIAFAKGVDPSFLEAPVGFRRGDRMHTL